MSIHHYLLSGSKFKKAKSLAQEAQQQQGEKADQLFQRAYDNFATISKSYSKYADAIYYWGFALLNQAQTKADNEAIKLYEDAITKFLFCKGLSPQHLGVAVDGGVALLGLAKAKKVALDDELYSKAKDSFEEGESIQAGSASYNLACLHALHMDGDACLKSLEQAREHGLVPEEDQIINDDDLKNVINLPWFAEFISSLTEEEEVEPVIIEEKQEKEDDDDKKE